MVSHGNFANWPAEFGKIFCGKLWPISAMLSVYRLWHMI